MIKTIIRAMYSAFISIVLISIILAGWTSYAFISQSSKSNEIINVIHDMYSSQKSVLIDVVDLSKILIKKTIESNTYENDTLLVETEIPTQLEDNTQLYESPNTHDNVDNPLGIVIEPSLTESKGNKLPKIREEALVDEQNELSKNEIKMDINS